MEGLIRSSGARQGGPDTQDLLNALGDDSTHSAKSAKRPFLEPLEKLPTVSSVAIAYAYDRSRYDGMGQGTTRVSRSDLDPRRTHITQVDVERHDMAVVWRLSEDWSLRFSLPYQRVEGKSINVLGEKTTTNIDGIGDAYVSARRFFYLSSRHRIGLGLGVSFPTGEVDKIPIGDDEAIPFGAQAGSGTYDLHPSISTVFERGPWEFGARASATVHLGRNSKDYRLGDYYGVRTWATYSISTSLEIEGWLDAYTIGTVDGQRTDDPFVAYPFLPENTGGDFLDAGFSARYIFPSCPYGSRYLEFRTWRPLIEDVNGTQVLRDWGVGVGMGLSF